jgi:hypothetical protein
MLLGLMMRMSGSRHRPVLAANPWVGVACLAAGMSNVSVTGIYAPPASGHFSTLRRRLGDAPVVTTAKVEADAWNAAGGRALHIRFGATFGYPQAVDGPGHHTQIFIGGSSDRDSDLIASLSRAVLSSQKAIELVIADGSTARSQSNGPATVTHCGYIDGSEFGRRIADSQVVFLPLIDSVRAAGHMVAVGALEAGVPVVTTNTTGMAEYVDGKYIRTLVLEDLLTQLLLVAQQFSGANQEIRDYWAAEFSLTSYVRRVGEALQSLYPRKQSLDPLR